MNKYFGIGLFSVFMIFSSGAFCLAGQNSGVDATQKSLSTLKNEILGKLKLESNKIKRDIKIFEAKKIALKFSSVDKKKQVKSALEVAKQRLVDVQKKIETIENVFNKRPSGFLSEWRKFIFYSINAAIILGSGFLTYKVFDKLNSTHDPRDRKNALMLASGVVGAFLLIEFLLYFFSKSISLSLVGAEKLDPEKYANLYKIIEKLCKKADISTTELFVMDENVPNAFATGPWASKSAIVLSKGLLALLNEKEVEGVLSHELSHIINHDVLHETMLFIFSIPLLIFSDKVKHSHDRSRYEILNDEVNVDDVSNFVLFRLVGSAMKYTLKLARLFVSRMVEYRADRDGAILLQDPLALASALEKMSKNRRESFFGKKEASGGANLIDSYFELFSTHPLDKKRIESLKELDAFYREQLCKIAGEGAKS